MKITMAAIQMESLNGDYEGNRKRAGELINDAAKKGARLIVLPEFALTGYIYTDELWKELASTDWSSLRVGQTVTVQYLSVYPRYNCLADYRLWLPAVIMMILLPIASLGVGSLILMLTFRARKYYSSDYFNCNCSLR